MDEYLEEIIKLAWKTSPIDTEYYLTKYIVNVTSDLYRIIDLMNKYEDCENDYRLTQKEHDLNKKINDLTFILSSLRGT